jgi:hypothetical protein
LFRCIDVADFFALFAEAQRAYGTRVFSDVTFRGVSNCVCVVTMYRVCVFSVVETVVTVLHDVNARDALPDLHTLLPSHCASIVAQLNHLQSLPSPTEAESARSVLPDFRLQLLSPLALIWLQLQSSVNSERKSHDRRTGRDAKSSKNRHYVDEASLPSSSCIQPNDVALQGSVVIDFGELEAGGPGA